MKQKKRTKMYLDHAAATPLDAAVFAEMKPYLTTSYANPSALYTSSVQVKNDIENARKTVADFLHTTSDTIIFTHGGTHSINAAILGAARAHKEHGKHIITSVVEHHAVLNTLKQLEKEGFDITYLPVDEYGFVTPRAVKEGIRPDTILVSIMYANNEVGTVEPIAEIGKMILRHRKKNTTSYLLFHTDACQAAGYLDMSVERLHVDLLSFNGSKIYGPKNTGVLFKRRDIEIEPIMFGGGQEFGVSPGTEDIPGVIGMSKAVMQIEECRMQNVDIVALRDQLWNGIQDTISDVMLNGPALEGERLPNNLNASFLGAESEAIILYLDAAGIEVSSGSACTTDSDELSHVLTACGYDEKRMKSSIRFTLGKGTTEKEIKQVLKVLPGVIQKVREMNA
ncbi:MAG: cysteine desulfurase NifS [Candidatus Magasanikbacteria bacterium CG_4_9_14_0_2_um_filter_42_11]|uniref:Cysteine desulfurase NifS n=1 Tax=Candidatus Magasanikbacteria bacterium CG_4_9_14_0_2_um_filter_42_11 TaxID=1974643 RepID=A0A2M8F967_9BACT|nr:MAG: cysteine desulfurase NifS [Candidatus Magasanikbacteria bacterium CG10_big_fil_rev_8_21_14_0_10_43_9]PIY92246.1 MAG: cysteine desulfurase NifS [Candidatus Magasanikbacteria bacterium CG_4_10_14_0_8_um_filter_42_12]PJC52251.1 MAG: cysteine desulfurase NifS [Candidatus Magasanikbacteria bacterium CG_4_9_14_0_2_um_filter_42_11]